MIRHGELGIVLFHSLPNLGLRYQLFQYPVRYLYKWSDMGFLRFMNPTRRPGYVRDVREETLFMTEQVQPCC